MYSFDSQKIGLESVINARDLGGYVLPDGRRIRPGRLLRGGSFAALTPGDRAILRDKYHLSVNFDFRTEQEVTLAPDRPVQGCKHIWLPAIDPATEKVAEISLPQEAFINLPEWLVENAKYKITQTVARNLYTDMVMNEYTQLQYAAFMQTILNTETGAVYWHCSQGKDRTGLGAAFILCALGADRDLILQDYRISNEFYKDLVEELYKRVSTPEERAVILTFIGVNEEYFNNALNLIEHRYGSLENYLKGPLCLSDEDFETLRERYLE